jgi:hypothetical protein
VENNIGITERSFRLKKMFGDAISGWAWIYDDNGEIYQDKIFTSQEAAQKYMEGKASAPIRTRIYES